MSAAVLFSTGGVAMKTIAFNGWQVAALRSGIAAVALFTFVPMARRRWNLSVMGIGLLYAVTMILFVLANKNTTAANAIFLQAAAPLYLLVLAPLMLDEPVTRADIIAMIVIAAGLALVMTGLPLPTRISPRPMFGNVMAVISGVTLAFTTIGLRWLGTRPDGEAEKGAVLVSGNVAAFLLCIPLALPITDTAVVDWALITYLGVFQIGLAYLLVTRGLRGVPAVEASLLMMIEPALNPIWVWLMHGEAPGLLPIAGGGLILLASIGRAMASRR
ncbi:MAG TPA: DMT family transporter [Gemmatimonadaceae bacterium]|nr:DMT family transporter [Gemmatimonadaceae bacterium]